MAFSYCISQIEFSDGTKIDLQAGDFLLIIGPNNSGKSEALRNILERTSASKESPAATKVIRKAQVTLTTGKVVEEFANSLERIPSNLTHVGRMGAQIHLESVLNLTENEDWLRQNLQQFFVRLLPAGDRLGVINPPANLDFLSAIKSHPIHYLYEDEALELSLSADFRKAFGTDLIVNHFAGAQIPLHIGERPSIPKNGDRLSAEYRTTLSQLPTLHSQGDGMKSFVATLLWARVSDYSALLIDEPEAFLHPPQARFLGRQLAKTKKSSTQIIAASHSGDFLRGVLDSNIKNLRIVRIVRHNDINVAKELTPEQLLQLWSDPLIRFSNLLDGLFHQQCVICESDGDCQFYVAVMQAVADLTPDAPVPEGMFASVGGKAKLPKAVNALASLNIRVKVIADFDVLREEQPLKAIFEGLGGDWKSIEADWQAVSRAISSMKAQLDTRDTADKINAVLNATKTESVPDQALREIRELTRKASAWSLAKSVGAQFVPQGHITKQYQQLIQQLESRGVFVVPVGELEGFDRSIGGHGPAWVGDVMQKDLAHDQALEGARKFVSKVVR